jgi:hypothetical protein
VPCRQLSADYSRFLSAGNSRVKVVPIPAQRRLALMRDAASVDGFCARGLILKRLFKGFQLSQSLKCLVDPGVEPLVQGDFF